ncbi:hypothetical protein FQR65_LT18333 [Abscondita terminalis]|nr:hypothetical protein FQR65_LT18333 [Abscondita terminalis]
MGICLTRTSVRSSWTRSSDKTVNNNQPGCRVVAKYLQWYKRRHTDSGSDNEFTLVKGKKRTSDSASRQRSSRASSEAPAKGSPDADN